MDRQAVEAAVASLRELLEDGDPSDSQLRARGEEILSGLRAAYRAAPALFTPETIETLRELGELLASL